MSSGCIRQQLYPSEPATTPWAERLNCSKEKVVLSGVHFKNLWLQPLEASTIFLRTKLEPGWTFSYLPIRPRTPKTRLKPSKYLRKLNNSYGTFLCEQRPLKHSAVGKKAWKGCHQPGHIPNHQPTNHQLSISVTIRFCFNGSQPKITHQTQTLAIHPDHASSCSHTETAQLSPSSM